MPDDPHAALRTLLLGEPPYQRPGAPEPELLGELAPVLPPEVLAQAVNTITGIGFMPETERLAALAVLLQRAYELGDRALLATELVRFPRVVPHLSSSLLEPAFAAVREADLTNLYRGEADRALALALLADRLPGTPFLQSLAQAALTLAKQTNLDSDRQEALVIMLSRVPAPLPPGEANALLAVARAMSEERWRSLALAALLPHFSEPEKSSLVSESLQAARMISWSPARHAALLELALHAPGPLQAQIEQEARSQGSSEEYLQALALIAEHAGPTLHQTLRLRVPAAGLPEAGTLRHFLPLLPFCATAQITAALGCLRDLWQSEQEVILSRLLPHLDESQLQQALAFVPHWQAPEVTRARLLLRMAPRFSPALAAESREIANGFTTPWWQYRVLAALRPHLAAEGRAALPAEVAVVSAEHWHVLFAQMPEEQRRQLVLEMIAAIWDHYGGAAAAAPPPKNGGSSDQTPLEKSLPAAPPAAAPPRHEPLPPDSEVDRDHPYAPMPPAEPSRKSKRSWSWPGVFKPKISKRESGAGEHPRGVPPAEDRFHPARDRGVGSGDDLEGVAPDDTLSFEPGAESAPSPRPTVNTGFAGLENAALPLPPQQPLLPKQSCYFWFEVSRERIVGAIDLQPTALPVEHLPKAARLKVALFAFESEIELTAGGDVGELQLQQDGMAAVTRPAAQPAGIPAAWLQRRLFFLVKMPARAGRFHLRCNIYCEQVLVQSHLVTVEVAARLQRLLRRRMPPALQTRVDFTLSRNLDVARLEHLQPHRLSVMLNDNGNGTHGFRFFGGEGNVAFKGDASLPGQELQNLITKAREALRLAAWGDSEPWQSGKQFKYNGGGGLEQLKGDLIKFAKRGYRFYDVVINRLAGGKEKARALQELMRKPGLVQIANKDSLRHLLPVAMLYDYDFDTTAPVDAYQLCPAFLQALSQAGLLSECDCFQGACPSRGQPLVICPSGFWGYRHNLGMPPSLTGTPVDAATEIRYQQAPTLVVAVSTDVNFKLRPQHEARLQTLYPGLAWHHALSREEAVTLIREVDSQVVYFYCHGGFDAGEDVPYLQVGDPAQRQYITRDYLRSKLRDLPAGKPQPLVFLNGCHTTALEPEIALDLVSGFVENARAAGVIGTEITIYEALACSFAEECLRHFLDGVAIGEAVRRGRLKLLQQGNPLGLVYVPYVVASLKLVKAA
ncbi:MAG: CHAT domain-containing protein [candidate division KSB1 bacterium]|nr:CHAT domain-containing protein [candidate division KSB1 bacterium]MDZ7275896.1 CHAT domain-containing protein [candidate division KSB1 bacterium]MDZ7287646.1 CHAT domain-containing protein [candidate division KSB1 bacterium]MDZ7306808.1 CHAT domain-containing protein [candidate division KSB1 bacterium]MDZ7350624.1 CHAT domain-containing protein [candidate division KSB1 bacterium]